MKVDPDIPIKLITAKDFKIFKLKQDINPDDITDIDVNDYETKEFTDEEKAVMFRPFIFKEKENYSIITEVKSTGSSTSQKLELYGVTRISTGYEDLIVGKQYQNQHIDSNLIQIFSEVF